MNQYIGVWICPDDLGREVTIGDVVMMETFDYTVVVEVSKIKDGELYHFDDWVIPINQIVRVKLQQ